MTTTIITTSSSITNSNKKEGSAAEPPATGVKPSQVKKVSKKPYVPPAPITAIVQEGSQTAGSAQATKRRSSKAHDAADKKSSALGDQSKTRRSSTTSATKKDQHNPAAAPSASKGKPTKPSAAPVISQPPATTDTMSSDRKKDRDRKKSSSRKKSSHDKYDDLKTPEPSSESGMRFDELYRLKGVVSVACREPRICGCSRYCNPSLSGRIISLTLFSLLPCFSLELVLSPLSEKDSIAPTQIVHMLSNV